jgi:hypothetical protein
MWYRMLLPASDCPGAVGVLSQSAPPPLALRVEKTMISRALNYFTKGSLLRAWNSWREEVERKRGG